MRNRILPGEEHPALVSGVLYNLKPCSSSTFKGAKTFTTRMEWAVRTHAPLRKENLSLSANDPPEVPEVTSRGFAEKSGLCCRWFFKERSMQPQAALPFWPVCTALMKLAYSARMAVALIRTRFRHKRSLMLRSVLVWIYEFLR